jgi:hypothetical protein
MADNVNRRRANNTMAKKKKIQAMMYKHYTKKTKLPLPPH